MRVTDWRANTTKDGWLSGIPMLETDLFVAKGLSDAKINMGNTVTLNIIATNKKLDVITGELTEYKFPDGCSFVIIEAIIKAFQEI